MTETAEGKANDPSSDPSELERRERLAAVLSGTTPSQRLAWLEQAIRFAGRAGALPRPT